MPTLALTCRRRRPCSVRLDQLDPDVGCPFIGIHTVGKRSRLPLVVVAGGTISRCDPSRTLPPSLSAVGSRHQSRPHRPCSLFCEQFIGFLVISITLLINPRRTQLTSCDPTLLFAEIARKKYASRSSASSWCYTLPELLSRDVQPLSMITRSPRNLLSRRPRKRRPCQVKNPVPRRAVSTAPRSFCSLLGAGTIEPGSFGRSCRSGRIRLHVGDVAVGCGIAR
jgi:hypothetical protein